MPRFDEFNGDVLSRTLQRLVIKSHARSRVLWRQAEHRRGIDALCAHLADDICDVGPPIAHANVNRGIQQLCQQLALSQRDSGKWRLPDQSVAMLHFLDYGIGNGTPTSHVPQVFGNFGHTVRRSMCQQ